MTVKVVDGVWGEGAHLERDLLTMAAAVVVVVKVVDVALGESHDLGEMDLRTATVGELKRMLEVIFNIHPCNQHFSDGPLPPEIPQFMEHLPVSAIGITPTNSRINISIFGGATTTTTTSHPPFRHLFFLPAENECSPPRVADLLPPEYSDDDEDDESDDDFDEFEGNDAGILAANTHLKKVKEEEAVFAAIDEKMANRRSTKRKKTYHHHHHHQLYNNNNNNSNREELLNLSVHDWENIPEVVTRLNNNNNKNKFFFKNN